MSDSQPPGRIPTDILNIAYDLAVANKDKSFLIDERMIGDVEYVCRCWNRSGIRMLITCLMVSIHDANVDIRKPFTKIGDSNAYPGRDYDQLYVAPFVRAHKLPCNTTTNFLTPAYRTIEVTLTRDFVLSGSPRKLYVIISGLLNDVYEGLVSAENLLAEIIRMLLIVKEEREQRMESLLTSLEVTKEETSLSAEGIINLIRQHLALPRSSRLPVLVVAAAYRAAQDYLRERPLALRGHNVADSQSGALGDLEIVLENHDDIVTAYEMKAKPVEKEDIDIAIQKVADSKKNIDNYIIITTKEIDKEIGDYAAAVYQRIGIEFVVLDCVGFLRHFLHLFYRLRIKFLEAYQELLLNEPESAVSPALKEAFLTLRLATEAGAAQPNEIDE